VRDLIDAMLAAKPDLAPWRIWERLLDEHDADISYSTVRGHIVRRRRRLPRNGADSVEHR